MRRWNWDGGGGGGDERAGWRGRPYRCCWGTGVARASRNCKKNMRGGHLGAWIVGSLVDWCWVVATTILPTTKKTNLQGQKTIIIGWRFIWFFQQQNINFKRLYFQCPPFFMTALSVFKYYIFIRGLVFSHSLVCFFAREIGGFAFHVCSNARGIKKGLILFLIAEVTPQNKCMIIKGSGFVLFWIYGKTSEKKNMRGTRKREAHFDTRFFELDTRKLQLFKQPFFCTFLFPHLSLEKTEAINKLQKFFIMNSRNFRKF